MATENVGGDWTVRGLEPEQKFAATNLSDDCIDAANRAQRSNPNFPGWQFYSRMVRGDTCFDRQLAAYAIALARAYSRCRKLNGRAVVGVRYRGNAWLTACAFDALERVIFGNNAASAVNQAATFDVNAETYATIRNNLADFMAAGVEDFRHELHHMLRKVESANRRARFFEAVERASA